MDSTLPDAARTSEQKETPFVADMSLPPVEEKPDSLPAESPIKVIPATTATSEEQQNGSSGEAVSGGTIGAIIGSIVGVMLLVVAGFVWTRKKARLDANGQNDQEKGNPHDSMPESHFELYNGGHGSTCPITHVDDRLSTPSMPESSFEYRESILDPVPAPKAAGQTTWLSRLNIFGIGKKEEAEPSPPSSPSSSPFAETPVSFDMNALNSYKNTFADRYTVDLELPNVSDESWAAAQATTPVTPRHPETGEALAHRALHGLYSPMISPESSTARDSARVGDVRAYSDAYTTLPAAHQMAPSHRYEAKEGDLAHNQAILQSQVGDQNRQDEHPANQGNFYYDSRYKSGMSVQSYDSYL